MDQPSESYLYAFYDKILSINCANLCCAEYPRLTIAASPQPLFGPTPPPEGVRPTLSKNDLKFLPKKQFPDFARIAVYSDRQGALPPGIATARDLVDSWEIKPLNCNEHWWTDTAKRSSMKKLRACMDQVYEAAMAGFAYNPDWKRVYALLVVGPYFMHVAWTSRPADDILVPTKKVRIPAKLNEFQKMTYGDRIKTLLENIQHYKARKLPDQVFFYNECVVDYPSKPQEAQAAYQDVSLTTRFLWALACPIKKHFPKVADTCQIFAPPPTKPPMPAGQRARPIPLFACHAVLRLISYTDQCVEHDKTSDHRATCRSHRISTRLAWLRSRRFVLLPSEL